MSRTNDGEVPPIRGGDGPNTKPLGERDYGRIDCAERKVVISANELRNPHPIAGDHGLCEEIAGREVAKEPQFRLPAEACFDEIRDLGDDQLRDEQRTRMRFQKPQTVFVVAVVLVDIRV